MSKRSQKTRRNAKSASKSMVKLSYGLFQVQYVTENPGASQTEIDAAWEAIKASLIEENKALNKGSLLPQDKDGSVAFVRSGWQESLSIANRVMITLPDGRVGTIADLKK